MRSAARRIISVVLVALVAAATLAPFLYMIATALMDEFDVLRYPPQLLPARPHPENFAIALTALPFGRFFLNTAIFAGGVVVGQVATSAMAAYAFARLRFPGRDRVFMIYLSVLMVPVVVLLVPRFLIINALGWVDTYAGLISTELVSVWGIFLLRDRKSTRLNSSHVEISYAVFCLKKKSSGTGRPRNCMNMPVSISP